MANREKSFQETSQKLVDNLLKTETIKGRDFLEDSQFQKESPTKAKERIHQEIHQGVIHSQKTEYFNPQNTFLHFSDKLRNALHNYQPPITKLSLELNPESLGSVELSITKRGESIHVQISSNQQALQLFMQNAQEFKNQLNNLGFHDIQMDFKDNSGSSLGGGFGGGDSQHSSQQEKKRNENGLYIYQQTEDPLVEISHLDLSFSYDA
ncbi:MAG: flagellar hook-length control protein FliK [Helicobacter sp.]|nr:flagellar hook-length control protein FliK [Helicobacter sp.]